MIITYIINNKNAFHVQSKTRLQLRIKDSYPNTISEFCFGFAIHRILYYSTGDCRGKGL